MQVISVVIPVYKVEPYLNSCIDSIVNQTYSNLEIILVDDGSPDSCGEICDFWAEKDPRVAVYHKPNGGLSDARNYGMEKAHGEYIAFIDSDDCIAPDYIEYLYTLIQKYHADISCCDFLKFEEDPCVFIPEKVAEPEVVAGRHACSMLFGEKYLLLVIACAKLYRTSIVQKYLFPVGRIHEDEATTCKFFYESNTVAIGNKKLYGYRQREGSITDNKKEHFNEDAAWCMAHRAQWLYEQGEWELAKVAWNVVISYLLIDSLNFHHRSDAQVKETAKYCAQKRLLDKKMKIKLLLYRFAPRVLSYYWHVKGYKNQ